MKQNLPTTGLPNSLDKSCLWESGGVCCALGVGLTAPYTSWCPPPIITGDRQRQAGPGKSRKPVHDGTCLEAVINHPYKIHRAAPRLLSAFSDVWQKRDSTSSHRHPAGQVLLTGEGRLQEEKLFSSVSASQRPRTRPRVVSELLLGGRYSASSLRVRAGVG